jgi:hypothetical protein
VCDDHSLHSRHSRCNRVTLHLSHVTCRRFFLQALVTYITSACAAHASNMSGGGGGSSSAECPVHILPHMSQSDHTAIKVTAAPSSPSSSSSPCSTSASHVSRLCSFNHRQALLCDVTGARMHMHTHMPPHRISHVRCHTSRCTYSRFKRLQRALDRCRDVVHGAALRHTAR